MLRIFMTGLASAYPVGEIRNIWQSATLRTMFYAFVTLLCWLKRWQRLSSTRLENNRPPQSIGCPVAD